MNRNTERLLQALSAVVIVGCWHLVTVVFDIAPPTVLPAPADVALSLTTLLTDSAFQTHIWATVRRTVLSSLIAIPMGIAVGFAMAWNDRFKETVAPILYGIYPMPVIALLPLLIVISGSDQLALFFLAASGGFFVLVWNAMTALESIDQVYFDAARDSGATSTYALVREVMLPGALPYLFVGIRLCLSTALLVAISVEFITADSGLGFFVWQSWRLYDLAQMYAAIVVIGALGVAITYGISRLHTILVPWETAVDHRSLL